MTMYTTVILFRDTPAERKFALRSIPAAIALKPDELIIGVDAPPPPSRPATFAASQRPPVGR